MIIATTRMTMTTTATVAKLPVLLPGRFSELAEVGSGWVAPEETGVVRSGWVATRVGPAGDLGVSEAWLAVGGTAEG
jgi:hypothetical protein